MRLADLHTKTMKATCYLPLEGSLPGLFFFSFHYGLDLGEHLEGLYTWIIKAARYLLLESSC